jgi:hypothetical protein
MRFVAACPSLLSNQSTGDEPNLPHTTTLGIMMPEVRLAVRFSVCKFVDIRFLRRAISLLLTARAYLYKVGPQNCQALFVKSFRRRLDCN